MGNVRRCAVGSLAALALLGIITASGCASAGLREQIGQNAVIQTLFADKARTYTEEPAIRGLLAGNALTNADAWAGLAGMPLAFTPRVDRMLKQWRGEQATFAALVKTRPEALAHEDLLANASENARRWRELDRRLNGRRAQYLIDPDPRPPVPSTGPGR